MRTLILILTISVLAACKSTEQVQVNAPVVPKTLWQDAAFNVSKVESPEVVFALPEVAKQQLDDAFRTKGNSGKVRLDVIRPRLKALFKHASSYANNQADRTMTASEAFSNSNANCLSLSILAYSIAEHLGLEAQFQQVAIPDYWAMDRGFNLLMGHINLTLNEKRATKINTVFDRTEQLIVDFDIESQRREFPTRPLDKKTVLAMFYNNKAAYALTRGEFDLAYSYLKQAGDIAPGFSSTFVNLGVLYRQNNLLTQAEQAYHHAQLINPNNDTALDNLVVLYRLTERHQQAEKLAKTLHIKRLSNPYYHIALGNEALSLDALDQAKVHFRKAISMQKDIHDAHFGLAKLYYQLGDRERTQAALKKAKHYAKFDYDQGLYSRKLNQLASEW